MTRQFADTLPVVKGTRKGTRYQNVGRATASDSEERERGFYIFSQPTRLYRCARVDSNLVKNISTKRL